MIFITLGSQKFQFNRLLQKIDNLIEKGIISDEVLAQIGFSDYKPRNFKYKEFYDRAEFAETLDKCDTVITHGGTGVIIYAVKKFKKVVAVARLSKYGEHVDDHQLQLVRQFDESGLICGIDDVELLPEALKKIETMKANGYISNTDRIIQSITSFIDN